ncbi:MAG: hypothetical protein CFH04_02200, partial [Alphaproteobacteria bacterium MarineAlpha3_Bin3]
VHVFVDSETLKSQPIPAPIRGVLEKFVAS